MHPALLLVLKMLQLGQSHLGPPIAAAAVSVLRLAMLAVMAALACLVHSNSLRLCPVLLLLTLPHPGLLLLSIPAGILPLHLPPSTGIVWVGTSLGLPPWSVGQTHPSGPEGDQQESPTSAAGMLL
jgi:hypothetical protein